jgi:predicted metal-dependent HD superfamily phosphohydrolase
MPDQPWPLPDHAELRDELLTAYRTGRGYHDDLHLREVLDRIVELGGGDDTALLLAAWFHDAVYDGDRDDEERSAALAEARLAGTEVDAAEVARLVRLTEEHSPEPDDRAGRILCDADLGILAAPAERYRTYAAGVRDDYAHIDDASFREGRLAVLEDLLARDQLFHTDLARERWEPLARANLAAEVAALRGAPGEAHSA